MLIYMSSCVLYIVCEHIKHSVLYQALCTIPYHSPTDKLTNLSIIEDLVRLLPIAALNAFGHTVAVIATFENGGASFT